MSQPKFNKPTAYYGARSSTRRHRPIMPLCWEIRERKKHNEWAEWMDGMTAKAIQEKKDGN